jgi:cob(I)alamin adenosyltransferase
LNNRVSELIASSQQCQQRIAFFANIEKSLNDSDTKLKSQENDLVNARNNLAILTNERNKLQLENARIPELERRVQVAEEQTKGIQSVASQIALLSQNM